MDIVVGSIEGSGVFLEFVFIEIHVISEHQIPDSIHHVNER